MYCHRQETVPVLELDAAVRRGGAAGWEIVRCQPRPHVAGQPGTVFLEWRKPSM